MNACPLAIPLADNALTTLADVKVMLGIDLASVDAMRDARLTHLINYVSAWVEQTTGRKLRRQVYTHFFNAAGGQELVMLQWPIVKVLYIKMDGEKIPPDRYDYAQTGYLGVIYKDDGWPLQGYRSGLAYDIVAPKRNIEVKYTAGYVLPKDAHPPRDPCTLPADLLGVVWQAIQQEWVLQQSGAAGLSAFSISDVSWTFDKTPNESWMKTLGSYTRL
ncbi:MAG: hypothetical protein LBJ11_09085 [Oscillospiraceae bacterium]|jgi:hypothetical protein|nr:hypothetical protein [Oscillospiraceae bacterium]